jgi:hypothetical protein
MGATSITVKNIEGDGNANIHVGPRYYQTEDRCLTDLRSTDPRDDKSRIELNQGGLLEDSYCWILDDADFRRWRHDEQSRLLWIKGDPGKGKTMLLCGIVDELKKSTADTHLLSFFFCQATDSRINNAAAVLRGLIYLLVNQQPSLISHIRERYDHAGKQLFEGVNAWVALSNIFSNILEDPGLKNTYLVIDALDECVTDLPQLLHFVVKKSSASPRVKWIVSSRNWPTIEESLDTVAQKVRLSLELNEKSISDAVFKYIQHRVDRLAQLKRYDLSTRDTVQDYLSSHANNTFLWVALVVQELADPMVRKRHTITKLRTFPAGLDSLYARMMEYIDHSGDADVCKRILAVVSVTYRPITLEELASLHDTPENFRNDLEALEEIIRFCGSLLILRDRIIYFVHQSAKDYLTKNASAIIFPSGPEKTHHDIFSQSLDLMSETLRRDMYSLRRPGFPIDLVKLPDPDPLASARYSCVYWVDHLSDWNSCKNGENGQDFHKVDEFLRQSYLYWFEALSLLRSVPRGILSMAKLEGLFLVSFN